MSESETGIWKKNNLPAVIFAGILSVILWKLPFAYIIFFPFSMFVTYIHEASHGIMALFTGGHLLNFKMNWDTSGVAYTSGGIRTLIVSAGYLGSSLWGALLLMAAFRKGMEKPVLYSFSAFFFIFTILFAQNPVSVSMGIFFGIVMLLFAKMKQSLILSTFLAFLAVQSCFNSISDIWDLLILSGSPVTTDAHIISQELTAGIVPPFVFALFWAIISAFFFFFALKKSI